MNVVPHRDPGSLGIVIPALDEEATLPPLLVDLGRLAGPVEIVVVDGGSKDDTARVAVEGGARVTTSAQGRARQMNAGAKALQTTWLLFLHADSRLPSTTIEALERWLANPHPSEAAHFRFRLDRTGTGWRAVERGQRLRERLTGLAYGDQGLLLSRRRYEAVGGFSDLPIMEDVDMIRRLRRRDGVDSIEAPIVTSARRFREEGPARAILRNAALLLLYTLGVAPSRLVGWYRPRRRGAASPAPMARAR